MFILSSIQYMALARIKLAIASRRFGEQLLDFLDLYLHLIEICFCTFFLVANQMLYKEKSSAQYVSPPPFSAI